MTTGHLYIAPDADHHPTIWRHLPDAPDRSLAVARRCDLDPALWAILNRAIIHGDPREVEPSFWYAEGYSVGAYGTKLPADLAYLTPAERDEYNAGLDAGEATVMAELAREG